MRQRLLNRITTVADVEDQVRAPRGVLEPFFDSIVAAGFLRRDPAGIRLTDRGDRVVEQVGGAWRTWLLDELSEWRPSGGEDFNDRVRATVDRIAARMMLEEHSELAPTDAVAAPTLVRALPAEGRS